MTAILKSRDDIELTLHSRGSDEYDEAGGQPVVTVGFPNATVKITAEVAMAIGRAGDRLYDDERRWRGDESAA